MAVGTVLNLNAALNGVANSPNGLRHTLRAVKFTSTDATIEMGTGGIDKIVMASIQRVGNSDVTDAGVVTIDETWDHTNGYIDVDADGEITLDRFVITSGGTLTSETFLVHLMGFTN